MKKIFFSVAFLVQVATTSFSQEHSFDASASNNVNKTIGRSELKINAMRNFKNQFPDANEIWSRKDDGFRAKFNQKNIKYMVDYDQKGKWVSTIRVYDESDLTTGLRKIIKPIYFDFAIVKVIEVKIGKTLVHFIKMENETSLLTLHIMNSEITELENYRNAGAISNNR